MNALLIAGLFALLPPRPQGGAAPAESKGPAPAASAADPRTPGTLKMAARLEELAAHPPVVANPIYSAERLEELRAILSRPGPIPGEARKRMRFGNELLKFGDAAHACEELEKATELAQRDSPDDAELAHDLLLARATAWFRLGEVENCIECNNCASCIAPITAAGVHTNRRGSERAIVEFTKILEESPDDYDARWLLNLANMTLGSWPDGVPAKWRLSPKAFESEYPLPHWENVASKCGVAVRNLAGGIATEDFDHDGFLDLMISALGARDQLRLFHNNGDGTFTERTHEAGLDGEVGGLNIIHADYDNDGWADVLVLRGAWIREAGCIPHSLLRNRGDGTFDDVTEAAGMLTAHPTQAAVWADFDGDGWLDLFIGHETQDPAEPHPCQLWHSNRDGTFTNVAKQLGVELNAFVKGCCAGDFDDDGRIDLYVSRRPSRNILYRNEPSDAAPGFRLRDVTPTAGVARPNASFPTWFFDYDNDGKVDLFAAANIGFNDDTGDDIGRLMFGLPTKGDRPVLYHNDGKGKFHEVSHDMGVDRCVLVMGSNYGDLDNDGWLDFYLGDGSPSYRALLPNKMFRNDGGRRFQDVTTAGGFGHLQKGHGIAFADLDNDGDQDIFSQLGAFYPGDSYVDCLFENPGNSNHWITLQLQGVKANRCAIGARIEVRVATPGGERSIFNQAGTGGSFGSSSLQQEIGLGDATAIKSITIRWPGSNTIQKFENVPYDRVWLAVEDQPELKPVTLKKFKLGG